MQKSAIASFIFSFIIFSSCSKKDATTSVQEEVCPVQRAAKDGNIIPGQYIVAYKQNSEIDATSARNILQKSRDVLAENQISASSLKTGFSGSLNGFVAQLNSEQAARLSLDPSVESVEPDRIIALGSCFTIVAPSLITWNINKTGYGNGIGKTAWIVDTGIDFDHPDLNVDQNRSRSFLEGQTSADDENGHGTHVAGIIGALNNNIGVLGVASGASLVSVRVLDKDGTGTLSSIIQALNYIQSRAGRGDVINLSLGEEEPSVILDQQVQSIAAQGIYISIAAGNDSKAANLFSPARANHPNIFTVSAVDSLDNFASFSNFGNDVVDYAAPGVRILSTFKDGKYARMSGTSMAAPHVAGLLLLNGNQLHSSSVAKFDPDGNPDPIAKK